MGESPSDNESTRRQNRLREGRSRERAKKFLGPIPDLEEYVQPDWWKHIFNSFYLKTDGDVVNDQEITRREVDLFTYILGLKSEDSILDLCCGHGRHSLELARRGFKNVEGLDISHYLIRRARLQAEKEGLKVKFREGDARRLPYQADTFDAVMILGNSFGYFESIRDDLQVLKEVWRVLRPWGKILIDVADGSYLKENYQKRSWEWINKQMFVCRERSLSSDGQRLISREVIVNARKGVIADQVYAIRLYNKDMLRQLLEKAGFINIVFQGELSPDSKRSQDLGMMEKRIIVTAIAKKEWTPVKKRITSLKMRVVVILGDASKTDIAKPGGVFDEDDYYTINKLIQALSELKEYEFIYLMNHDTLVQDLLKLKNKIDLVFNLCDEGFYNDRGKELHIPALLDVLGIPYTGAGPQCLAYCFDKSLVRGIAREMGIPVPRAVFLKADDIKVQIPFDFPVIIKPNFGDSSFGITSRSVAYNEEQLLNAISELKERFNYNKPILIEEFLTGKDLTLGIIGNPPEDYIALPITEEDYSVLPEGLPPICSYEAKWIPDSPYWNIKSIPANIPQEVKDYVIECSVMLFNRLGCRDYARFDWRLDSEGNPRLLEVNPNPGWCWDGHLAKAAAYMGMSYPEMLRAILKSAEKRLKISKPPQIEKIEPVIREKSSKL
jgi:D-alanine-D-alanine ligase